MLHNVTSDRIDLDPSVIVIFGIHPRSLRQNHNMRHYGVQGSDEIDFTMFTIDILPLMHTIIVSHKTQALERNFRVFKRKWCDLSSPFF